MPDYITRRRAAALLKEQGATTEQSAVEKISTRNTPADYQRALARIGRRVAAVVTTDKGKFTIEFVPAEAPLTVDNFIRLANQHFFDNVRFHRVVPNFVIQGGDPRGDGNGGPVYQIRCEINEVPYTRGAVGMALSGKDTGGSQWFVTHSPQPHLDGGYTVFGRVTEGMEVVDRIARGDLIRSVQIIEGAPTGRTRAVAVASKPANALPVKTTNASPLKKPSTPTATPAGAQPSSPAAQPKPVDAQTQTPSGTPLKKGEN